jgi:hypothetical protein
MSSESDFKSPVPHRFALGVLIVDADVHDILAIHRQSLSALLARHAAGDWGDVTEDLRERNNEGVAASYWLKSLYRCDGGSDVIGVRTNAQRTETHVRVEWDAPQGLLF